MNGARVSPFVRVFALIGGLVVCSTAPAPARAFDPVAEAFNYEKSNERFADDETSPGFQEQLALQSLDGTLSLGQALAADPERLPANPCAARLNLCAGDPRLYDWGDRYGIVRPIAYVNRNGALISGHIWAPLPRRGERIRRIPAVALINGDLAPEQVYWWGAESVARAGYLVMTFDPQGHGASDTFGAGDDRDRHVDTQQAAGSDSIEAPADEDIAEQTKDALRFLLSIRARRRHHRYLPVRTPGHVRPASSPGRLKQRRLVRQGEADRANPLRRLLTRREVGLVGHSRGADAVSIVGSRDRRIDAIVAWDNLLAGSAADQSAPSRPVAPKVPALAMSADYYIGDPPYSADPGRLAKASGFLAYESAGVDSMQLMVRGGTHFEWSYTPTPALGATLRGIDMASWYTVAWLDRYLKHDRSAERRLLTNRWRSDEGEAAADPQHDGNMFSFYYDSAFSIHVHRSGKRRLVGCANLRAGCGALVPDARDGYSGEYSYLDAISGPAARAASH